MEIFAVNYQAAAAEEEKERVAKKEHRLSISLFSVHHRVKIVRVVLVAPNGPIEFCMNHLDWSTEMNLNAPPMIVLEKTSAP